LRCKEDGCGRRASSRGWCSSHYRRWWAGVPMDVPIRGYVRYEAAADGTCRAVSVSVKAVRSKREKPFAAEWALLKELDLCGD
jgi:hypothetical protein